MVNCIENLNGLPEESDKCYFGGLGVNSNNNVNGRNKVDEMSLGKLLDKGDNAAYD